MADDIITPKPQEGIWTLTAPDGRTWQAESPLRVVAMESRERIPAQVALQRILDAADEPLPDERRYRWLKEHCTQHPDEFGQGEQLYFGTYKAGEMDAAIDAAMSADADQEVKDAIGEVVARVVIRSETQRSESQRYDDFVAGAAWHMSNPDEPLISLKEAAHAYSARVIGARRINVAEWLLYEHDDGRHAVAPSAEAATFAHDDPAWHRVGPVEVPGLVEGDSVSLGEAHLVGYWKGFDDAKKGLAGLEAGAAANAGAQCDGCPTEDECSKLGCGVRFGQIVPDSCPACNGYGRVGDGSGARPPYGPKCPTCGGSGRVPAGVQEVPRG